MERFGCNFDFQCLCCLSDGQRAGVTPESIKSAASRNQLSVEEARKILGIDANAPWEEVVKVLVLSRQLVLETQLFVGASLCTM